MSRSCVIQSQNFYSNEKRRSQTIHHEKKDRGGAIVSLVRHPNSYVIIQGSKLPGSRSRENSSTVPGRVFPVPGRGCHVSEAVEIFWKVPIVDCHWHARQATVQWRE